MSISRAPFSTCYKDTLNLQLAAAGMAVVAANRQWVADIVAFNWAGGTPPAQIKFLKAGKFPPELSARFNVISRIRDWSSNKIICEKLNIPLEFAYSPLDYKYMFAYYKKFNTLEIKESLEDSEFLSPLKDKEHKSFIAFF